MKEIRYVIVSQFPVLYKYLFGMHLKYDIMASLVCVVKTSFALNFGLTHPTDSWYKTCDFHYPDLQLT